jgi:glutathione S-transferase
MSGIELIGSTICPYVQRVKLALFEKEITFQDTNIDLANKPAWLKDISPYEKVPVLKHRDSYIFESTVINEYLEEEFPHPTLIPDNSFLRSQMRIWINFCDNQFITHFFKVLMEQNEIEQNKFRQKILDNLFFIEQGMQKLSEGPYWFGKKITLTDLTFFPFFERFPVLEHYRKIQIPEDCQRLKKWIEIMKERASAHKTMNSLETHLQIFKKYADNSVVSISSNEMRNK